MAKCCVLLFLGIALDGYVELNAARTSIQRVVLFVNSRKSPYRFVFDVAMVQNCHFRRSVDNPRVNQQLYAPTVKHRILLLTRSEKP